MRRDAFSRRLMREARLAPAGLILPLFVQEGVPEFGVIADTVWVRPLCQGGLTA